MTYCLVCGFDTLDDDDPNWEICPICFWEHDLGKDDFRLNKPSGANHTTPVDAQISFVLHGAVAPSHAQHTRPPTQGDRRDPQFELLPAARDALKNDHGISRDLPAVPQNPNGQE
jgi:hypothetical protein